MVGLIRRTPEQVLARQAYAPSTRVLDNPGTLSDASDVPSFGEATAAAFQRENFSLELMRAAQERAGGIAQAGRFGDADVSPEFLEQAFKPDPNFQPITALQGLVSEDEFKTLEAPIRRGMFDDATNENDLRARVENYKRETELLKAMEDGPLLGAIIGSFGAAATDIVSLSIGGGASRLRTIGRLVKSRAGRYAAEGAIQAAIPEIGLQAIQELRTAQESFLNIGTSGLIGGGIGALARFASRKSPMHPDHPDNPLNPDNLQPIQFRNADGEIEEIIPESVGAAAADTSTPKAAQGVLRGKLGKLTGVTIGGRALTWTGNRAREAMMRMIDLGGQLTDNARLGVKIGASAEDYKRDFLTFTDQVFAAGSAIYRGLNTSLGGGPIKKAIGEDEFSDIARRHLLDDWAQTDYDQLVSQYGEEAAPKITAAAKAYAEKIHATNDFVSAELRELGLIRDDAAVDRISTEISQIDAQLEAASRVDKGARTQGSADRVDTAELRAKRKELREQLDTELEKAPDLGREYGHAQLYDSRAILMDREGFTSWLLDVMAVRPDEDWLFDLIGQTDLPEPGQEINGWTRDSLLREWVGDEQNYLLTRSELDADAAEQRLKEALLDFEDTRVASRFLRAEAGRLTLSKARKTRDRIAAAAAARRAQAEEQRAFAMAFKDASAVARATTIARDELPPITAETLAEAEEAIAQAERRLFVTISDTLKDPATAGRDVTTSGEYVKRVEALGRAEARLEAMRIVQEPGTTVRMARAHGRMERSAQALKRAETRMKAGEEALAQADSRLARIEARQAEVIKARQAVDEALLDAKKAHRIAEKDARKARAQLRKLVKQSPLHERVDRIFEALVNRDKIPHGVMDRVAVEPGRVKARRFLLTPEQRRAAEASGYLRTDLGNILRLQYDQVSGWTGLHRSFRDYKGTKVEKWSDVERMVADEYHDLARTRTDADRSKFLDLDSGELGRLLKDLRTSRDRLLGTTNVGTDRDGWLYWLSSKVRQHNFLRFGAGFGLTSMTDVGMVFLTNGALGRVVRDHFGQMTHTLKQMHENNPSDFLALIRSVELGAQDMRIAQLNDVDDTIQMFGIGPRGSLTQRVTGAIDYAGRGLSQMTNVVSGMHYWNRSWKVMTALYQSHRLRSLTGRYDSLDEKDLSELASLGIGRDEALRLHRYMEKHGDDSTDLFDPRLEEWTKTADGREAARDFRIAIERARERAIITPGIGDTPVLMDHFAAKMFFQFQSFAFTFMNRFLIPASQRLATFNDMRSVIAYGHLAWSGALVVVGKDIIRGEDPSERLKSEKWGETAYDIIDRSGAMAWTSPYVDSVLKVPLGDTTVGGAIGVGTPSRFVRNTWWQSALGPSFGWLRDMAEAAGALGAGDPERIRKKTLLIAPWNTHIRMAANNYAAFSE